MHGFHFDNKYIYIYNKYLNNIESDGSPILNNEITVSLISTVGPEHPEALAALHNASPLTWKLAQ